jgi:hypothetical protein
VPDARIYVALELPSTTNTREHWSARAARAKYQREVIRAEWMRQLRVVVDPPAEVIIARIAPRALDDDTLAAACKAVRDQIAQDVLRVDDRDDRVRWIYRQTSAARPRIQHVEVIVRHVDPIAIGGAA